ncbi:MAG: hypothetical protein F6K10_19135 [Moorea sp. SIO2B7]|nr:hypothetical protein [Moorena sp. SIO2B7]
MNIETPNKISKRLSLAEIYQYYLNRWVLLIEPHLDDNLNILDGEVVYHTSDKEDLYNHLHLSGKYSSALEYIAKNELLRTSATSSKVGDFCNIY